MEEIKTHVALFDIHYPKINKAAIKAALQFLEQNKVDSLTLGGDQFHFDCISHHTKGKGLYRLPNAYEEDVTGFDREILKPIEERLQKHVKKVYHIGNHERFENDLIEEQPQLKGTIDHVKNLKLKERGWDVIPLGHCSKIGKLIVAHGEILPSSKYPAQKAVELYENSVLVGHTHAPQSYAKISPVEKTKKHIGYVSPCMCDVNPSYLKNGPTNWLTGINIIETRKNGEFNLYQCIITNGKFSFAGKLYGV